MTAQSEDQNPADDLAAADATADEVAAVKPDPRPARRISMLDLIRQ